MINLLPDNSKREIRAARNNVILLRYNFIILGVAGFLLLSCIVVYAVLGTSKSAAESTNTTNSNRTTEFAATKKEADEYRKNLDTAKQILNNEVNYTDLVFAITNLLPKGVVLDSLNLNSKDFGTKTLLNAHAKDFASASELKRLFENSSLFSDVHFQSIVAGSSAPGQSAYPIGITINVTMNKVVK